MSWTYKFLRVEIMKLHSSHATEEGLWWTKQQRDVEFIEVVKMRQTNLSLLESTCLRKKQERKKTTIVQKKTEVLHLKQRCRC
jgi:hypothetical protein